MCRKDLPLSAYHKDKNRKDGFMFICKDCVRDHRRTVRQIKETAPPKPTHCENCGKETPPNLMRCDHDKETNKFRGWVCNNCNVGMGLLGDTLASLQKTVEYLSRETIN